MTTIYIDMDGVVADFNEAARQLLAKNHNDVEQIEQTGRWPLEEWEKLRYQSHFYRNLPKTPIADQVIELARAFRDQCGYELYMLTAIPRKNDMPSCFHDKIKWMTDYYPDIEVRFGPYSHDKQIHCNPGDILVDDRTSNCEEWRAKNGIAIQVRRSNYAQSLTELRELLKASLA